MVAASTNSLCGVALAVGYGGAMWANKSPFLAPIYDQVPSMLYNPQKHVYKQKNKKIDILAQIMSKIFTKGNIKDTHKKENN